MQRDERRPRPLTSARSDRRVGLWWEAKCGRRCSTFAACKPIETLTSGNSEFMEGPRGGRLARVNHGHSRAGTRGTCRVITAPQRKPRGAPMAYRGDWCGVHGSPPYLDSSDQVIGCGRGFASSVIELGKLHGSTPAAGRRPGVLQRSKRSCTGDPSRGGRTPLGSAARRRRQRL
jgi:hypothetical protein